LASSDTHLTFAEINRAAEVILLDDAVKAHLARCADCAETLELFQKLKHNRTTAPEGHICLTPEEFAQLTTADATESLLLRAAECSECSAALRAAFPEDGESIFSSPSKARPPAEKTKRLVWIAIAASLLVVSGAAFWLIRKTPGPQVLLAQAYTVSRPFEYRLPDAGYGRVRQARTGAQSVFARPEELVEAESLLQEISRAHPDSADILLLKGRAELIEGHFEAAIASITLAQERDPSTETLNDLACAYAVRGDAEKRKEDYGRAAELLLQSLRTDDKQARTWFNLALLYQRLWLVEESVAAWRKFLALDATSPWANEARQHLAEMEQIQKKKSDARRYGEQGPEAVRAAAISGQTEIEAYLNSFWTAWLHQPPPIDEHRDAIEWYANAILRRHGDYVLEAATRLTSKRDTAALRALGSAITANLEGRYEEALHDASYAEEALLDPVKARATAEVISALQRTDQLEACIQRGRQFVAARVNGAIWPRIQAEFDLAACLGKIGKIAESQTLVQTATNEAGRSGYALLRLRGLGFLTSLSASIGATGTVWASGVEGLELYWKSAAPLNRFHQFAFDLSRVSRQSEWWNLARVLSEAHIRAATRIPNRSMEALGEMQLAALLEESGERGEAQNVLARSIPLIASIEDSRLREVYDIEARVARASALADSNPAKAISLLTGIKPNVVQSEFTRRRLEQIYGHALLQSGEWQAARERLQVAKSWIATAKSLPPSQRLDLLTMAEPMYRDLVRIEWDHLNSPEAALRIWTEFREAASTGACCPRSSKPGTVQIVLITLGAEVRGWITGAEGIQEFKATETAEAIRRQAAALLRLCSRPDSSIDQTKLASSVLLRQILGTVERAIVSAHNWRIDADDWLALIPFETLILSDGRFAAEAHSISYGRRPLEGNTKFDNVFVVAADTSRGFEGNRLPSLTSAAREAARIAARWSASRLEGGSIRPSLVLDGMARSTLFHFAGHGWSNGGSGGLLLGDDAEGLTQVLSASDLAGANLSRCRLAVLSACLTAAGETRGPINAASLVRGLLGAGVQNVVASRWNADGEAAASLFDSFYESLVAGAPPADALRAASMKLLYSPESRHPYYWAAFSIFS